MSKNKILTNAEKLQEAVMVAFAELRNATRAKQMAAVKKLELARLAIGSRPTGIAQKR